MFSLSEMLTAGSNTKLWTLRHPTYYLGWKVCKLNVKKKPNWRNLIQLDVSQLLIYRVRDALSTNVAITQGRIHLHRVM